MATRGSPEAPVFCERFTGTVRYKSPTEALTVPVNAQAPFNRPKYRYTVAAGDGAPTSSSIHLLLRYQLARGQYKYLPEARCIRRLVDPLSLPLWTSVDSPATARPFFFSHAPFVLVSIPFFFVSSADQLFSLIQTRRENPDPTLPRKEQDSASVICAHAHPKILQIPVG